MRIENFLKSSILAVAVLGSWGWALNNGLALTPPMGWNDFNTFGANITEADIKGIADVIAASGFKDAGYVFVNVDDNWFTNPARGSNGVLTSDPKRFPDGMKALGDYIHAKGLKFGIYGDRGLKTCDNIPQSGSYGNEVLDAKTWASWGVDYVKVDNCFPHTGTAPGSDGSQMGGTADGTEPDARYLAAQQTDYTNISNAVVASGRPMILSICAWRYESWMPALGNLWRTENDIKNNWASITKVMAGTYKYAASAKPGAWNDPDCLEVGNMAVNNGLPILTIEEQRSHFGLWCIMASPLIMGNDPRNLSAAAKAILLNKEAIAIDQDSNGIQGTIVHQAGSSQVWMKPIGKASGNSKAVLLFNGGTSTATISATWAEIGLPKGSAAVRDIWATSNLGNSVDSVSLSVPAHGLRLLRIEEGPTSLATTLPDAVKGVRLLGTGEVEISGDLAGQLPLHLSIVGLDGRVESATELDHAGVSVLPRALASGMHLAVFSRNGQPLASVPVVATGR